MNEVNLVEELRREFPQLTFIAGDIGDDKHALIVSGPDGDLFDWCAHVIHWSKASKSKEE